MVHAGGGVQEGVLVAGGLEDEQNQGQFPAVVLPGVAAPEVAAVVLQPGAHPPGRGGPPLELQEAIAGIPGAGPG